MLTDMMLFFFLFDDQFDGPIGMSPIRVKEIADSAIAAVHGPQDMSRLGISPIIQAYADLWKRSREGMSAMWRGRAARNWKYYFAAHVGEAIDRCSGVCPTSLTIGKHGEDLPAAAVWWIW